MRKPDGVLLNAERWCDQKWTENSDAVKRLEQIQSEIPDGEIEKLMHKGMHTAAARAVQETDKQSMIASFISMFFGEFNGGGEIYLNIPELEFEKRFQWGDPETTRREREAAEIPF